MTLVPGWRISRDSRTCRSGRFPPSSSTTAARPPRRSSGCQAPRAAVESRGHRQEGSAASSFPQQTQPPYRRQAARNGVCALSDYRLYLFFTLSVHFGDAPIVDLPDTLDRRSWGEFDAYLGDEPCLKQAANQVLLRLLCFCPVISNSVRCQAPKAAANRRPPLHKCPP